MISLIFTLTFTYLVAHYDANLINNGRFINDHKPRWIFRAVFISLFALFNPYYIISLGLIFTALFDPTLNKLRGLNFWHIGTVAKWDKFFSKRLLLYKIVRISCLTIGLILHFY